jgi:hypothetical protein
MRRLELFARARAIRIPVSSSGSRLKRLWDRGRPLSTYQERRHSQNGLYLAAARANDNIVVPSSSQGQTTRRQLSTNSEPARSGNQDNSADNDKKTVTDRTPIDDKELEAEAEENGALISNYRLYGGIVNGLLHDDVLASKARHFRENIAKYSYPRRALLIGGW